MSASFVAAVEARRSYYALSPKSPIPDEKIKAIVETAVKCAPTPFNIQSGRAVVFLGASNQKVWQLTSEKYLASLPAGDEAQMKLNKEKLASYATGYGSVLFFEDMSIVNGMVQKMPYFTTAFPIWSENATGMLQYIVWVALEAEGFGASLQHHATYVDTITPAIAKEFALPESWKLTALMPFGVPTGPAGGPRVKTFVPIEERVKVFT